MVQLELTQDVEERLKKAAEARGLKPEAYAIQVIEGAVRPVRLEKHLTKEQMQEFQRLQGGSTPSQAPAKQ